MSKQFDPSARPPRREPTWSGRESDAWPKAAYICPKCGWTVHVAVGCVITECGRHGRLVRAGAR